MPSNLLFATAALVSFALLHRGLAEGGVFLASRDDAFAPDLLQQLEAVVGREHREAAEGRVGRLEHAMCQMYASLPKDPNGRLGADGVRYMLRRLFVKRHGWFVHGLESGGEAGDQSLPTVIVRHQVGEDAENVFEDRLRSHGFTLRQAAILAATLETFVHAENTERLHAAYALLRFDREENSTEFKVNLAMRAYMLMYMRGLNHSHITRDDFKKSVRTAGRALPFWRQTKEFLEGTRRAVLDDDDDAQAAPTSWKTTLKVLDQIGERFGRWQDTECHDVKDALLKLELPGTGRVPLTRFYNSGWHFVESVSYLRLLGALDESDPLRPSVIIPNYLNGPNNCLYPSKFYSVCCIDQCDTLLGYLEDRLASPSASPGLIAQLVASLPSDTVQAPRALDSSLVQRLSDIAAHHGGQVPIHGRLFAQFMHYAYPRECSYPYMSGTIKPMTQDQFIQHTGAMSVKVTTQEIERIADEASSGDVDNGVAGLQEDKAAFSMWSSEEELFVGHHSTQQMYILGLAMRVTFAGAACLSMFLGLLRLARGVIVSGDTASIEKWHYV